MFNAALYTLGAKVTPSHIPRANLPAGARYRDGYKVSPVKA